MSNDKDMVIRMIEYDFHFALRHGIQMEAPNIYTLYFPNSTVLYPEKNDNIPENLICRVIFPDGSIHQYNIPTMKIQTYSLEDIRKIHLTMFLPFKLLSFRPRLKSVSNPIRENELTEYINLAAERVFHSQPKLKEEVLNVTKSVLILPSDLYREAAQAKLLRKELDEKMLLLLKFLLRKTPHSLKKTLLLLKKMPLSLKKTLLLPRKTPSSQIYKSSFLRKNNR